MASGKKKETSGKSTAKKPKNHAFRVPAGSIYGNLAIRLLLVLGLMSLSRILFLLLNWSFFSPIDLKSFFLVLLYGIRFDISAILLLNVPVILMNTIPFRFRYSRNYQRVANAIFYVINTIALMVNFIDTVYYPFTLKRMTADIFHYVEGINGFSLLLPQFLKDFWYMIMIWVIFVVVMIWGCRKFRQVKAVKPKKPWVYYLVQSLLFVLTLALVIIGIRGGIQLRPIGLVTAGKYTAAKYVPAVLNTPFSIIRTMSHPGLEMQDDFSSRSALEKIFSPRHRGEKGYLKPYNVLILILESFSMEHIGSMNPQLEDGKYRGFTPFFDSLVRQGLFVRGFANEKTSIMGVPAILSGIPSLMNDAFIQSSYASNQYSGIAGLLAEKGYHTAFFHGGNNGTMGLDQYTHYIGFEEYYGREEYHDDRDFDGKWGIWDEPFLQFTARKLDQMKKPFMAAVFTLSSHHPYKVPGKYRHLFPPGNIPIQKSIQYTDYALKQFFKTISKTSWYSQTLIVLTADHASEAHYPYYHTNAGQYAIPMLFLLPGGPKDSVATVIAQQTDIVPSVLDWLNYDQDFISFGTSLFDTLAPRFSVHYNSGIYSLIKDGFLLDNDGNESIALFDLTTDPLQNTNLIGKRNEQTDALETFIKAYIQQYNNRLIENRLME